MQDSKFCSGFYTFWIMSSDSLVLWPTSAMLHPHLQIHMHLSLLLLHATTLLWCNVHQVGDQRPSTRLRLHLRTKDKREHGFEHSQSNCFRFFQHTKHSDFLGSLRSTFSINILVLKDFLTSLASSFLPPHLLWMINTVSIVHYLISNKVSLAILLTSKA